jgi:hypothetical protein
LAQGRLEHGEKIRGRGRGGGMRRWGWGDGNWLDKVAGGLLDAKERGEESGVRSRLGY